MDSVRIHRVVPDRSGRLRGRVTPMSQEARLQSASTCRMTCCWARPFGAVSPLPDPPLLAAAGLGLESINMISLMTRLEGDYDISFPDDAVGFATFAAPIALWNTVCELRVSEARPA
ncbi:hypothetical protein ACFC5Z_43335 [Streptomyces sp. NPDC056004]|uniref:hypothetical protein n=1 Tax=unclassified Streptomyces TaxID=2593676 RepID=UPI0035D591CA